MNRDSSYSHPLAPGLRLDGRLVLWVENERTLVAADLHLGYAWAHRHGGQLLPISGRDDTVERLGALAEGYGAAQVVLLGDIVHRAVPVPAIREEVEELAKRLEAVTVRWIAGNHDRGLEAFLPGVRIEREVVIGPHLLTHGAEEDGDAAVACLSRLNEGGWLIMGHEHPAIHLHDGVTTSVKCPCFIAGARVLVLPAFSPWAAGTNVRGGAFMSAYAQGESFSHAYAVLGGRILAVRL